MTKIYTLVLIWGLYYSCGSPISINNKNNHNVVSKMDTLIKVFNGEYYLLLNTTLSYDTLSEESRFNDRFSTPFIQSQKIMFYDNKGKQVQEFLPAFDQRNVLTSKNKWEKTPSVYLWDVCLLKREFDSIYYIYGSGLCNGTLCPEYYMFFDQNGNLLCDGYSDIYAQEFKKKKITTLQNSLKINIDSVFNCESISTLWKE